MRAPITWADLTKVDTQLEKLLPNHTNIEKAVSVFQFVLQWKSSFRQLPAGTQRKLALEMYLREAHNMVKQQILGGKCGLWLLLIRTTHRN